MIPDPCGAERVQSWILLKEWKTIKGVERIAYLSMALFMRPAAAAGEFQVGQDFPVTLEKERVALV